MDVSKKRERHIALLEGIPVAEEDDDSSTSGVLLSDKIQHYAEKWKMIEPFEPENLKAAGYELSIGDEFFVGGVGYSFRSASPPSHIEIPPFEVAVIKTNEILRLPRFIIARWNLRVRWAYEGLLWIGAAQVDPGFSGNLFCPIYNLSDRPVELKQGEHIALIDFVKTTEFVRNKSKEYPHPRDRDKNIIEDYNCHRLRSALITRAEERINETVGKVDDLSKYLSWFTTVIISLIAIFVAIGLSGDKLFKNVDISNYRIFFLDFGILFSIFSSIMFFSSWRFRSILSAVNREFRGRHSIDQQRRLIHEWRVSFIVVPAIMLLLGLAGYFIAASLDDRVSTKIEKMQQTVNSLQSQFFELKRKVNASAPD